MLQNDPKNYIQEIYPVIPKAPFDSRMDIHILIAGSLRSLGSFQLETRTINPSLHIIVEGAGVMQFDGCSYEVSAGSAIAFFRDKYVLYYDFPESPWHYIWFRLEGRLLEAALASKGYTPSSPAKQVENFESFRLWLEESLAVFAEGDYSPLFPSLFAWELVERLNSEDCKGKEKNDGHQLAVLCRSLIDNHISGELTIRELSRKLGVDRTTLFRTFRKSYGISPKKYIDESRFRKARAMLLNSSRSIKEIAYFCGFESPGYFSTAFRKQHSLSPQEWRIKNFTARKY